ncbi:EmrB/QacA subfamily drug resistance transporter [Candidatus Protofrankia californiensis]|uniref:EmrB/QacA subfamily drug resistance transporter n=1 Tax=Candidatus Protofrankia californiensis TaxID=1839754 RepID=A0A1C3NZP8_9ACTN|nr:EmrB/QacA subfamily drug resistance transporter [Candidatus Protofrankia californiensis]
MLYGLSRAGEGNEFTGAGVLACLATGAVLTAGFVAHALRSREHALIDVRLFRSRPFSASAVLMFLFGISLYGPMLLLPLYYQQVRGYNVADVGLLLAPQGISTMLTLWLAGRWSDRIGPRRVALAGITLSTLATLVFAQAGTDTHVTVLAAALVIRGAGLGAAGIAVASASYRGIARSAIPRATSLLNITQRLGASFGTAVLAVVLQRGIVTHPAGSGPKHLATAFGHAFWWALAFAVIAVIPALALPARPMAPTAVDIARADTEARSSTCAP